MQHHYTYQTYLINMDRAKDRLQMMKVEFEKTGMNYERIQAVDAKELKGDEYLMRNQYDRNLVPGEIGCYLSHVKTMENFLKSDYDYAFIVEDDAILPENLKQIIEESLSQYKGREIPLGCTQTQQQKEIHKNKRCKEHKSFHRCMWNKYSHYHHCCCLD